VGHTSVDPNPLRLALTEAVPAMLDDVIAALVPNWPEHASFLESAREEIGASAELAIALVMDAATGAGPRPSPAAALALPLFHELGRDQARSGASLASLLSAYQAGARAAWRHLSRISVAGGLPADTVASLAEGIFWLVDQISSASAAGYTEEQSLAAAELERDRAELSELLLSDRSDSAAINAAALRARWPLPVTISVVLFDGDPPSADDVGWTRPTWLPFRRGDLRGVLAAGGRDELAAAFRGSAAVVGVPAPPTELPATLDPARVALRLRRARVVSGDPVFVEDHLDAVIVHRDPALLAALRADVLAPLDGTSAEARARLERTLASWLDCLGDGRAMAAELHVHPQTIRYRLGKLRALFGTALDDPLVRRRLALVLTWQDANGSAGPRPLTAASGGRG